MIINASNIDFNIVFDILGESMPIKSSSLKETAALLVGAIKKNDLGEVKILIQDLKQLGGKLDHNVGKGNTFLHLAASIGHEEISLELLNQGANLNVLNDKGLTPMESALWCDQKEIASILLSLGGLSEGTNRKILSHIWGIRAETDIGENSDFLSTSIAFDVKKVRSEGIKGPIIQLPFIEHTVSFFNSDQFKQMHSLLDVKPIVEAVEQISENSTKSSKELAEDVLKGKIVLLHTGWPGHRVAVGFMGSIVIKTNAARKKGLGQKQPVNLFYRMQKTDQLEACINGIMKMEDRTYFHSTINQMLDLKVEGETVKSAQKIGHCSWASLKDLLHGVLELECDKIYADQNQGKQEAFRIYKAWKYYVSKSAYSHYLYNSTKPSIQLVMLVNEKNKKREEKSKYWCDHVYESESSKNTSVTTKSKDEVF